MDYKLNILSGVFLCSSILSSCCGSIDTPADTKYLPEFNDKYFSQEEDILRENQLKLYIDNSTCNALGQYSDFYQRAVTPSLVSAAKKYFSIKGKDIVEEDVDNTYTLLRSIKEVNYADLKTAAERIANDNTEGVLVTDGEYYEPSIAAGNITNPYMTNALKTWLIKGHEVYIISEPYTESYKGQNYDKKRFYFLFTDTRIPNNIWNRISQTGELQNYPNVDVFHLSISRPFIQVTKSNDSFIPNEILSASVKRNEMYEIQDWSVDWKVIENIIVSAVNQNTGEPLPNGDTLFSGIRLDRNSFGALKIENIGVNIYNINTDYNDFYCNKFSKTPIATTLSSVEECPRFMCIDDKEFKSHSNIDVYFDLNGYDPKSVLTGSPFNYLKIDFNIKEVKNIFKQYSKMFEFSSIDCQPGQTNVSIEKSVEQCLADPAVMQHVCKTPFYTIYVKCNQY
ncbi:MAG: hypothetical protein RRY07_01765 [Bacteroidaceae bacterium]